MQLAAGFIAAVGFPAFLGARHDHPLHLLAYAVVAGIAFAIGEWLDRGLDAPEIPFVLLDALVKSLVVLTVGGIVYIPAYLVA